MEGVPGFDSHNTAVWSQANLSTLLGGAFVHKSEAVRALKESKLFSGLLAAQLQALEQTAQLTIYRAGDRIFEEGQPGDGLYIIVKGKVAISTLIEENRGLVLAILGPGDFFVDGRSG